MREIKFRAWDKNKNKMIYPLSNVNEARKDKYTPGGLIDWFEDEDLMQFTGLLDKNGKEIYEGDILDNAMVIVFDSMFARFGVSNYDIKARPNWVLSHTITKDIVSRLEVIGNIYENPELISK